MKTIRIKLVDLKSFSLKLWFLFLCNGIKLKKLNLELSDCSYASDIFIYDKHHSEHPSIAN